MPTLQETAVLPSTVPDSIEARRHRWPHASFVVFLIGYTALLNWFGWVKLMAFDELLSFYTARASTLSQVLQVQRSTPVSLDPPLVHLAAHCLLQLGVNPFFSVRLPSLLGAVLMMACVWIFTRRLTGDAVASLAVVILLIVDQFHMVEARPYGVMLGLSALALVLWQNTLRNDHRGLSLLGLWLTLGAAISSHYFGILLLVPFVLGECLRMGQRRALDFGITAALAGSLAFVVGWLPFLAGAHQYKSRYYIKVQWADLARSYASSLQPLLGTHVRVGEWLGTAVFAVLLALATWLGYQSTRRAHPTASRLNDLAQWAVVVAFALLPVAGVLLAKLASGAFEIRYVVEFTLGTTICGAAGLMALLQPRWQRNSLLVAGCVLAVLSLGRRAVIDGRDRIELEQIAQAVQSGPTVLTDKEQFLYLEAYHREASASAHAFWVADLDREIAASGSDNIDRTMQNLKIIAGLPVISYADLLTRADGLHLIVNQRSEPQSWLPAELVSSGRNFTFMNTLGSSKVYRISPAAALPSVR